MKKIRLKPCPFCGGEAITAVSVIRMVVNNIRFTVCCPACNVGHLAHDKC